MTRQEAIKQLGGLLAHCMSMKSDGEPIWDDDSNALEMAILALSPITREQVEKMVKHCEHCADGKSVDGQLILCGNKGLFSINFCPFCGAPIIDQAVDILWKRLEAMQDAQEPEI